MSFDIAVPEDASAASLVNTFENLYDKYLAVARFLVLAASHTGKGNGGEDKVRTRNGVRAEAGHPRRDRHVSSAEHRAVPQPCARSERLKGEATDGLSKATSNAAASASNASAADAPPPLAHEGPSRRAVEADTARSSTGASTATATRSSNGPEVMHVSSCILQIATVDMYKYVLLMSSLI